MNLEQILSQVFSEYGFIAVALVSLGFYFKAIIDRMMNESNAREEKLMSQNESRELRFIETINNLTNHVSMRIDNIEEDVKEIKESVKKA